MREPIERRGERRRFRTLFVQHASTLELAGEVFLGCGGHGGEVEGGFQV